MFKFVRLSILVFGLLASAPAFVQAEGDAPADVIVITQSWQQFFGALVAILVGGSLLYVIASLLAKSLHPDHREAIAEAFERGYNKGREDAEKTPQLTDDLAFHLAEPFVNAVIALMRSKASSAPETIQAAEQRIDESDIEARG